MTQLAKMTNDRLGVEASIFTLPNGKFRVVMRDSDAHETVSVFDHAELSFVIAMAESFVDG